MREIKQISINYLKGYGGAELGLHGFRFFNFHLKVII